MNLIRTAKRKVRSLNGRRVSEEESARGTDILDTLKKEHEEVEALLNQLVDTESGSERKKLVKQIKSALVPHTKAEEKVVYRAVIQLKDKEAQQDGEEGIIEHQLVSRILADLGKSKNAGSPQFSAQAKVLKELVQHHVQEEEGHIWRDVRENFSDDDRAAMNRRFETEKGRVRVA